MKNQSFTKHLLLCFGLMGIGLTGCSLPEGSPEGFVSRLRSEWKALKTVLVGGRSPLSGSGKNETPLTAEQKVIRAKGELLQEMYKVVFEQELRNSSTFEAYLSSLAQGGSLEGIYNGFARSAHYRELERKTSKASPETLRVFSEEVFALNEKLLRPEIFQPQDALPLEEFGIHTLSGSSDASVSPREVGQAQKVEQIADLFKDASVFTLKRILGEQVLRLIEERKSERESLARWYSEHAVRIASYEVKLGLKLREKPDLNFHRQWALTASLDQVLWESLNRVHRMISQLQKKSDLSSEAGVRAAK